MVGLRFLVPPIEVRVLVGQRVLKTPHVGCFLLYELPEASD